VMLLTGTSSAVGGTTTALEASYLVIDRPTNTVLAASDPQAPFRAASVIKLLIALDYLHRAGPPDTIPSGDRQLLESMLRRSDDAAASVLWRSGGSAAIVERTATRLGLTGTRPPADPAIWGYTTITATDIARIYRHLLEQVDPQTSGFILDALHDPARCAADGRDQYFGIPAAAPRPWAVKQGWSGFGPPDPGTGCDGTPAEPSPPPRSSRPTSPSSPSPAGSPDLVRKAMHTTGLIGPQQRLIVVVLTLHPDGTAYADAAADLDGLTRRLCARATAARAPA
jgi:Beta-lactamase enzyme family